MLHLALAAFASPPASWPPYSHAQCIGQLATDATRSSWPSSTSTTLSATELVRNTGGGSARCCSMHPVAAPARVFGGSIQLQLQPREAGKSSRNGARVYLAESCAEGDFARTVYASTKLLGRTLSMTVDLSAAKCGCNAAFYLVSMAQNHAPGQCDGDYCMHAPSSPHARRSRRACVWSHRRHLVAFGSRGCVGRRLRCERRVR